MNKVSARSFFTENKMEYFMHVLTVSARPLLGGGGGGGGSRAEDKATPPLPQNHW